jgi:hypothetical protein
MTGSAASERASTGSPAGGKAHPAMQAAMHAASRGNVRVGDGAMARMPGSAFSAKGPPAACVVTRHRIAATVK